MGSNVRLRRCERSDLDEVLDLWRRAGIVPRPTDHVEALETRLAFDDGLFLIADDGGPVVGSLIGAWDGWRGGLYRLAVDPEYRRRGIATALVREVERRMRELGATRVPIRVFHEEAGAVEFWTSVGYSADPAEAIYVKDL